MRVSCSSLSLSLGTRPSRSLPAPPGALGMLRTCVRLHPSFPAVPKFESGGVTVLRRAIACSAAAMSPTAHTVPADTGTQTDTLETLRFDSWFTKDLPADSKTLNRLRDVENAFFSWVEPTPTGTEAHTIVASPAVAALVGLDPAELERPEFADIFSGNAPLPGSKTYAQCYGGHQFGTWAGQLGDGRAICLGEVTTDSGEHWELQLKGAGKTPYSRMADGRAVLRSSIREFVASEAMAALGVPTTRALSLVATGDSIYRDMFYDGHPREEPGAVVCRVAHSFVRFGTFQLPCARGGEQLGLVRTLADHVIARHFPHLVKGVGNASGEEGVEASSNGNSGAKEDADSPANPYAALLVEVAQRTAATVVHWHRVGFVHGVLNTDNMSILGDTIDYGPFAFIERFDPNFTPNTTDLPGRRYAFRAQPGVCQFNLLMLGKSLVLAGLISKEDLQEGIDAFGEALSDGFSDAMRRKLGMEQLDPVLYGALMSLMVKDGVDFTNTWRALGRVDEGEGEGLFPALAAALGADLAEDRVAAWTAWVQEYRAALSKQALSPQARRAMQDSANPAIVPRNHVLVQLIEEVESGNTERFKAYLAALAVPYEDGHGEPDWKVPGPREVRRGVELLSCSS